MENLAERIAVAEARVEALELLTQTMHQEVRELRNRAEEQGLMIAESGVTLKNLTSNVVEMKAIMLPSIQNSVDGLRMESSSIRAKLAIAIAALMFIATVAGDMAKDALEGLFRSQPAVTAGTK